jgi:uncharacterized membrane protein YfcA
MACAALGILLAAGGGIGGGGILVPVYVLVGSFAAKEAVPLSNVTILGGSIANCFFNFMKKHPYYEKPPYGQERVDRPRIDFDIVNVMEPMTIAGSVLGSLINKLLPGWLLTIMLMVVLGLITIKTILSGRKKWIKEGQYFENHENAVQQLKAINGGKQPTDEQIGEKMDELEEAKNITAGVAAATKPDSYDPLDAGFEKHYKEQGESAKLVAMNNTGGYTGPTEGDNSNAAMIERMKEEEKVSFPRFKLVLLFFCWVGVNCLDLFRGGGSFTGPFDVECGDLKYWILTFMYVPFTCIIAGYVACYLMADTKKKDEIGYPWVEGDVRWTPKSSFLYPLICSTAGLFAGMFGVGGGIVKGPLMNEMGVLPEVTQATAAFMIFFTASSATVSYALYGLIIWSYAIAFFFLGMVFTAIGQVVVFKIVEKTGRSSIIVFVIGAILGVSTVLLAVNGFSSFAETMSCDCSETLSVCGTGQPASHGLPRFATHSHHSHNHGL